MKSFLALLTLVILPVWTTQAGVVVYNLVAPPDAVKSEAEVRLSLLILNPTEAATEVNVPVAVAGRLSNENRSWPVELRVIASQESTVVAAKGFAVREYALSLPRRASGRLVLETDVPTAARLLIDVRDGAVAESTPVRAPLSSLVPPQTVETAMQRTFLRRFNAHEPIYFIFGDEPQAAKFQFSFRYRIMGGADPEPGKEDHPVRRLELGYTQRSLWDIQGYSSPFYDTSYMPEVMFTSQSVIDGGSPGGFKWLGYQVGVRHESNGRDGFDSRSMNVAYFRPGVAFGRLDGWNLVVAPRFITYLSTSSDNADIRDYRGNVEFMAVFGRNDRFALTLAGRLGRGGHKGSMQADLTIPVRFERALDFATYFLIQYWDGYGESLKDYNVKTTALRAGFSLVR